MSYQKRTWINDETELSAENFNHIEDGVEKSYGQLLIAVSNLAPEECNIGDRYYDIDENKIYTATNTNTWGELGQEPELGVFYIVLDTKNIYTYDGETLISVGGGAGGDSEPVGTIKVWAGDTAPEGYLLCDGDTYLISAYPDLAYSLGSQYWLDSEHFAVPDLRGRVPVGLNINEEYFNALGKTGGEATHTLTIAEMPSHTHSNSDGTDKIVTVNQYGGYKGTEGGLGEGTLNSTGENQPHNNLQPYIVINYIIKATKIIAPEQVAADTLPYGTIVEYDGDTVPTGYEEVEDNVVLLWENPLPGNEFGEQKVELDLSNYKYFIVESYRYKIAGEIIISTIVFLNKISQINYCDFEEGSARIWCRNVNPIDTGIIFGGAALNSNVDNYALVPYRIWGYK